jgi:flagellar protein FlgJ
VQGEALKTSARFRAYPDQASAFRDYAGLLLANPRFRGAVGAGSDVHAFAEGLARGGYATDPAYADKLARVAGKLKGVKG